MAKKNVTKPPKTKTFSEKLRKGKDIEHFDWKPEKGRIYARPIPPHPKDDKKDTN